MDPPPKRQKLDTAMDATLSSQPLPPDGGSEFDKKVLESCAAEGLVESMALRHVYMTLLLVAILKNEDLVQNTFKVLDFDSAGIFQASKLITEHPELQTHLQEAWKSKNFEWIRQLPFLQAPSQDQGGGGHQDQTTNLTFIQEAWKQPYQTHAHEVLYESICEMWAAKEGPYKNILAVIQSSGYGKTRMLDEHAKLVFTFPFVIRNPKETTGDLAYPHPDQCVHEFLTTFGNTEDEIRAGYYKFLTILFNSALAIINEADCQPESLPAWWRSYLAEPSKRRNFYSEVVYRTKTTITPSTSAQSEIQEGDNPPKPQELRGGIKVEKAAEEFLQVIPTPKEAAKAVKVVKALKAVIYFDEAHELAVYKLEAKKERNRLDVLYSCLDIFTPFPLMFIFTSTTSSIHQLASTRGTSNSARRAMGKSVDQAPITELPFDCHPSLSAGLEPNGYSFQAICELEFLANFGRPLFWSLLKGGEKQESVLRLAKYKLAPLTSGTIYQGHELSPDPTYSLTAIIDLLLMLDYNPDHKTVQELQKKLVSSHMRTCISIPADREYICSCYPSEPFLAEAAMTRLTEILYLDTDNNYPDGVIDTVNSHFSHGLLHSGDLGELATRMLLMDAYMTACKNADSGEQVIYSRGCKLTDFLKHLFRKPEIVLEAKPDNVFDGLTFKDAFKDAVVRFTHFGKFVDDTATSRDAAHAAFFRSMAIICHDTQKSVDIIVPVLSTTDGAVCQHVITSILIQVKRCIRPGNPRLLAIDQSNLEFFPPKVTICNCAKKPRNTELPYISFVLDLGVRAPELTQALASPTRPSSRKQPPKHHRYAIYTRGLSSYGSVTEGNLSKYERLLRLSNVLGDHPRQSSSHLDMVRRLKPFWARGEAFDWIKNEALTVNVAPTEGDALEVGKYEGEDDT